MERLLRLLEWLGVIRPEPSRKPPGLLRSLYRGWCLIDLVTFGSPERLTAITPWRGAYGRHVLGRGDAAL